MLNKLDDYPIHQTPEPIAVLATSDRNAYDRTWFNGYAGDGSYYFGIGMAVYPHRGIIDCAFSTVRPGERQHCFYGSRRAPDERTDTSVGPFRLEVIEPMRRTRVILDDNASGLSCDLTFSTRTAAIQEARQTLWSGTRRIMDATRFDQFGRCHRAAEKRRERTACRPFLGLGGAQFGGCLNQRRIGPEGAQRRLVAGVDHRLCDADELTSARFIFARERQTVAGGERGCELVANLEREIGAGNL